MILRHPTDALVVGFAPKQKFFVGFADVTETVHAVADLHDCSPASEWVLAQAFASVSLMGAPLSSRGEALSVQADFSGEAAGFYVEHTFGGALRGYVRRKNLPDPDPAADPKTCLDALLGDSMTVRAYWTRPGQHPDAKAVFRVRPASFQGLVDQFFLRIFHLPTLTRFDLRMDDRGVEHAMALMFQCRLDGDMEGFIRRQAEFADDGRVADIFADPVLETVREILDIEDLGIVRNDPLAFRCGCSPENALATQPVESLRDAVAAGHSQTVTCQFCGASREFSLDDMRRILAQRTKET